MINHEARSRDQYQHGRTRSCHHVNFRLPCIHPPQRHHDCHLSFVHFEPSLDASSLRPDVIESIKIVFFFLSVGWKRCWVGLERCRSRSCHLWARESGECRQLWPEGQGLVGRQEGLGGKMDKALPANPRETSGTIVSGLCQALPGGFGSGYVGRGPAREGWRHVRLWVEFGIYLLVLGLSRLVRSNEERRWLSEEPTQSRISPSEL